MVVKPPYLRGNLKMKTIRGMVKWQAWSHLWQAMEYFLSQVLWFTYSKGREYFEDHIMMLQTSIWTILWIFETHLKFIIFHKSPSIWRCFLFFEGWSSTVVIRISQEIYHISVWIDRGHSRLILPTISCALIKR